jgi:hypothetical protein
MLEEETDWKTSAGYPSAALGAGKNHPALQMKNTIHLVARVGFGPTGRPVTRSDNFVGKPGFLRKKIDRNY